MCLVWADINSQETLVLSIYQQDLGCSMCNIRDHQVGQLTKGDGDGENFRIENCTGNEMTFCQHV